MKSTALIGTMVAAGLLLSTGCIGTDTIDEITIVDDRIVVDPGVAGVMLNGTITLTATYYDGFNNAVDGVTFVWSSLDETVVTVDGDGVVLGVGAGQADVLASAMGIESAASKVGVVTDSNEVATITIDPTSADIVVDSTVQFTAIARNVTDGVITGAVITWASVNPPPPSPMVVDIDSNGLATGISAGTAMITAEAEGKKSQPVMIVVLPGGGRNGIFEPVGGHAVDGDVSLVLETDGSLHVDFAANFSSIAGPDLEVYLTVGASVNTGFLSLGSLRNLSGADSYAVPAGTSPMDYNFVLIHCVPFNVTFGRAQLN